MDGSPSKPNLLERIIHRISGNAPDTAEGVLALLQQAHEQQAFDADTMQRLEKVLDFAELEVRDAMITRSQMSVVKAGDSLYAKDLLKYIGSSEPFDLESLLRPACFVPEGKSLNALLKTFREQRLHMAIVVDEYGGTSGLVTFEDVIEQIIGNIEDEFDEDDSADNIFSVSAERWRINAVTEIEDINAYFGTDYSGEEADTIGGLVIQELGRLPVRGDKIALPPLLFTVARADHRRLHTLMAVRMKDKEHGREPHKE